MTARPWCATDRGAVALTGLLVALSSLAVVLPLVLAASDIVAAGARARTAADAAALAVMAGSPLAGGDGPPDVVAAAAIARDNGAELVGVDLAGWPVSVVVQASARPAGLIAGHLGALPAQATARAVPP